MYSFAKHITVAIVLSLVGLVGVGCTGADPMTGTWTQSGATTRLPDEYGGGDLNVDVTLDLDGTVSPATFDLLLGLGFSGLSDTVVAHGTYTENGSDLTLSIAEFEIDPESGNVASVSEDGANCIVLQGFGGVPVCFATPQTNGYALDGDNLAMIIDQAIATAPETETNLSLSRLP